VYDNIEVKLTGRVAVKSDKTDGLTRRQQNQKKPEPKVEITPVNKTVDSWDVKWVLLSELYIIKEQNQ
jgi:hypothetical protein